MKESPSTTLERSPGSTWRKDLLASLVVFLVALPLCMGISIASGVSVSSGLVTAIVAGLVVGFLSGAPLQVSGPAAGLTVIVAEAVQQHGKEMIGLVVLVAGLLQLLAGTVRLGQWFRAVSPAVVNGMLAGIGVLIFASQFHVMLDDRPKGSGIANLASIPDAIAKAVHAPEFPARDLRHEQRGILMRLGVLHEQQEDLNTEVAGRIPHHKPQREKVHVALDDLAPRQQEIADKLDVILADSHNMFAGNEERQARVRELGSQAHASLRESLLDLQTNRDDLIIQSQANSAGALQQMLGAYKNHELAAAIGVATIIALVAWSLFARGPLSIIPAPLVAVLLGTALAALWQLPVLYVEIPDSILQELHSINWTTLTDAPWSGILASGLLMAVVASAETLLSAAAVDQMQNGPRCQYNKELFAQGVGNTICGFLGAIPMTGVIVRSSANIHAGAQTRLSAILHGVWLLTFVLFLGTLLRMIPTSALAAILVYTGYKLVNVKAIKNLAQYGWGELVVYFATVTVIVVEDLLIGVLTGLALAIGKLVLQFARLKAEVDTQSHPGRSIVRLNGAATFLNLPQLARTLEKVPAKSQARFEIDGLRFIDQACLELLRTWVRQHEATGGRAELDLARLQEFAKSGAPAPAPQEEVSRVA